MLLLLAGVSLGSVAGQQAPVFRAAVDRVRVDVVVTDGSDRPIADLKREDFAIVENGRPQTITDFRFVSVPLANRTPEPTDRTAPSSDVATNAPASELSRLWAIMVDDLHVIEADIVPVKRILGDFVRALPPQDEVAIVYVGRSNISVNFTSDVGRLLTAIDKVRDAVGFGLDALPRVDSRYVKRQAETSADALRWVAASLASSGHPRRAIVYVGAMTTINYDRPEGIQFIADFLEPAFEQARRSNVPIYTIDPRGLVQPQDAVRGGIAAIGDEKIARAVRENIRFQQHYLSTIAVNTGGRAFINNSDLTRAVHEIIAENGSFYELAYSPDPLLRDGKFHDIDVKVNRPGVRVRARRGYVAPGARPDAPPLQQVAETSMASGVNVAGLILRAVATPIAAGRDGVQTAITVELTYPLQTGTTRIDDTLALSVYALDPDARVKARSIRRLRFAGGAPPQDAVTLLLDDLIELPSQPLTIRIGVASEQLGRAGTVQLPLDVPDPGDRLQLSGIALGLADRAAPALNAAAIAPLVPFQPTTGRAFRAGDTLRAFGRVFWRGAERPVVTIGIRGTGQLQQATLLTQTDTHGTQAAAFESRIPLRELSEGAYVLEVTAHVSGRDPVTRAVPFAIR